MGSSFFHSLRGLISHHFKGVIIGNMLFVIQQFSGIAVIFYYGPNIIMKAGFRFSGLASEGAVRVNYE